MPWWSVPVPPSRVDADQWWALQVTRWVEKTQGKSANERKSRKPGLFWR